MDAIERSWEEAKFKVLLEACSHAINRARYVFIIINIAGVVTLAGLYNSTFAWLRHAILRAKASDADHLEHIQRTLYSDLWTISIPLLGVKLSVFDLSVIASATLCVLALWQYYCVRRENEVVCIVVDEAKRARSQSLECALYLYHGIAHYFVFTTRFNPGRAAGQKTSAAPMLPLKILLFMPAWVPLLIVISEIQSVIIPNIAGIDPSTPLWKSFGSPEKVEFVVRIVFTLLFSRFSWYLCSQGLEFDSGTRNLLDDLNKDLTKPSTSQPVDSTRVLGRQ